MMSFSDPLMYAARAARMSDSELFAALQGIKSRKPMDDFQQAVVDEAQLRGMLTSSEFGTVTDQSPSKHLS